MGANHRRRARRRRGRLPLAGALRGVARGRGPGAPAPRRVPPAQRGERGLGAAGGPKQGARAGPAAAAKVAGAKHGTLFGAGGAAGRAGKAGWRNPTRRTRFKFSRDLKKIKKKKVGDPGDHFP